jgi:hypothetical protein
MGVRTKSSVREGIVFRSACFPSGGWVVDYQPGNATRYLVSFMKLTASICDQIGCQEGSTLVSWIAEGRSYPFIPDNFLAWPYVHEKLGGSEDDARCLTELIALMLGRPFEESWEGPPLRVV